MNCLTAPLNLTGDISARYIGAKPAFKPELIPIKNLPKIISSYEPEFFEIPRKKNHVSLVSNQLEFGILDSKFCSHFSYNLRACYFYDV